MQISKIINRYKKNGLSSVLMRIFLILKGYLITTYIKFINYFKFVKIDNERKKISKKIFQQANGIVQYGFFKGMKLLYNSSWGLTDKGSMILGFYESEITNEIFLNDDKRDIFIDIGGADGYYSTGALFSKKFKKCICFESDKNSQYVIKQNAKINGVSENLIILGIATEESISKIFTDLKYSISNCLVLCDIEGAEFDLFNENILSMFSKSKIIIEIHPWMVENGSKKYELLKEISKKFFNINILTTKSRDLSIYRELDMLPDNDRWLLCSEGRSFRMEWLILTPKDIQ